MSLSVCLTWCRIKHLQCYETVPFVYGGRETNTKKYWSKRTINGLNEQILLRLDDNPENGLFNNINEWGKNTWCGYRKRKRKTQRITKLINYWQTKEFVPLSPTHHEWFGFSSDSMALLLSWERQNKMNWHLLIREWAVYWREQVNTFCPQAMHKEYISNVTKNHTKLAKLFFFCIYSPWDETA